LDNSFIQLHPFLSEQAILSLILIENNNFAGRLSRACCHRAIPSLKSLAVARRLLHESMEELRRVAVAPDTALALY